MDLPERSDIDLSKVICFTGTPMDPVAKLRYHDFLHGVPMTVPGTVWPEMERQPVESIYETLKRLGDWPVSDRWLIDSLTPFGSYTHWDPQKHPLSKALEIKRPVTVVEALVDGVWIDIEADCTDCTLVYPLAASEIRFSYCAGSKRVEEPELTRASRVPHMKRGDRRKRHR